MPNIINTRQGDDCINYSSSTLKNSSTGNNCIVGDFSRVYNSKFGNYVRIDRNNFILESNIGDYTYTGQLTVIMHSSIGNYCSISWGVTIGAGEHDYTRLTTHDFLYNTVYDLNTDNVAYNRFSDKMELGSDIWIGTNATICRGIKIGHGAVIGANAVVTKDVPPYAIVVGSPAKIIKYRFDKKVVSRLLELQWWNLPSNVIKEKYEVFLDPNINKAIDILSKE